jgi:glycosyltransferase involved in cell wall biosynthesis
MLCSISVLERNHAIVVEMERLRILESGLGQYCFHLGRSLLATAPLDLSFQFYVPNNRMGIFGENAPYRAARSLDRFLGAPSSECSLWHCTHQDSCYWPRSRSVPVVMTVHDLNFLQPGSRPVARGRRLRRLQSAVSRASAIIVISRFTEAELRRNIHVEAPVHVIYPGNCLDEATPQRPEWCPDNPFLLSLGHIHPKKNLHVLLLLLSEHPNFNLILAGTRDHPYAAQIESEAERLGVRQRLLLPGTVSDEVRLWLYRSCEAFLLPSLAEGFGLPAVEAMSQGKPVFLARRTSLPEVGGDIAFYWDDFDPATLNRVLNDGLRVWSQQPKRAEKSRRWAEQFSWSKCAAQHLALYRQIIADAKF